MLDEMIEELDEKVEFLINKNIQYSREIEMLRALLDEANSNIFASENSENTNEGEFLSELKPLAEKILSKIKKAGEE